MQVVLNGKKEEVEQTIGLLEFLQVKGLNPETIIVEYNGNIMKKDQWLHVVLQDNDCLEVLNFVGGG